MIKQWIAIHTGDDILFFDAAAHANVYSQSPEAFTRM